MKEEDYWQIRMKLIDESAHIQECKSNDYASKKDIFDNFKLAEVCGVSVEQGIFTRMTDKISRLGNYLKYDKTMKVKDENFKDTIIDLINYSLLLYAKRKEGKK